MKIIIKKLLNFIFADYEIFKIYSFQKKSTPVKIKQNEFKYIELNEAAIRHYDSVLLNKNISYSGNESIGFACLYENEIVGLCFFWYGNRYLKRNFISLKEKEAKLVQIETVESMKGKGVAPNLIAFSSAQMFDKDFEIIYARIWHSNIPSVKCFTKANWQYQYTIVTGEFKFGCVFKFSWPFLKMNNES